MANFGNYKEECPSGQNIGTFNRLNYDNCAYDTKLRQSTDPLQYHMSRYKFENCSRCSYDGSFYAPYDLVNQESELRGINRMNSRCPSKKYNGSYRNSKPKNMPVIYPPELTPVVWTNIKKKQDKGYILEPQPYCENIEDYNGQYYGEEF